MSSINHMTNPETLKSYDPASHEDVQELDEQIQTLEAQIQAAQQDADEERTAVDEARRHLKKIRTKRQLGEASKKDEKKARKKLEKAKKALEKAEDRADLDALQRALEVAKTRRENAVRRLERKVQRRLTELHHRHGDKIAELLTEVQEKAKEAAATEEGQTHPALTAWRQITSPHVRQQQPWTETPEKTPGAATVDPSDVDGVTPGTRYVLTGSGSVTYEHPRWGWVTIRRGEVIGAVEMAQVPARQRAFFEVADTEDEEEELIAEMAA